MASVKLWGIRFGFLFVGGFAVIYGLNGLYVRASNLRPIELTCQEYLANRPTARWVRLTGCWALKSRPSAVEHKTNGRVTREEYFAPLADGPATTSVLAFLYVGTAKPPAEDVPLASVEGLSQTPFMSRVGDASLLSDSGVDREHVILDPEERPAVIAPLAALLIGLGVWFGLLTTFRYAEHWRRAIAGA